MKLVGCCRVLDPDLDLDSGCQAGKAGCITNGFRTRVSTNYNWETPVFFGAEITYVEAVVWVERTTELIEAV